MSVEKGLSVPQWKKELLLRRRALSRSISGSGSVQLRVSCPRRGATSEPPVPAVQQSGIHLPSPEAPAPSSSPAVDFLSPGSPVRTMRFLDQDLSSSELIPQIKCSNESDSDLKPKMVEEKPAKKTSFRNLEKLKEIKSSKTIKKSEEKRDDEDYHSDSSEELQYGPGIVNKLKSKYLSMTLRDNQKHSSRPSLSNLRRATSLENMLEDDSCRNQQKAHFIKKSYHSSSNKSSKISLHHAKYLGLSRGSDSMKRARSMDTLLKSDSNNCLNQVNNMSTSMFVNGSITPPSIINEDIIIIDNTPDVENKHSAKKEDTELPPPDVVKQTLKIFEQSTNKKPSEALTKVKIAVSKITNQSTKTNNVDSSACKPKPVKPSLCPKPAVMPDKRYNRPKVLSPKRVFPVVSSIEKPKPPAIAPKVCAISERNKVTSPLISPKISPSGEIKKVISPTTETKKVLSPTSESFKNISPVENKKFSPVGNKKLSPTENKIFSAAGNNKFSPVENNKFSPVENNKFSPVENNKFSPVENNKFSPTIPESKKIVSPSIEHKSFPLSPDSKKVSPTLVDKPKVVPSSNLLKKVNVVFPKDGRSTPPNNNFLNKIEKDLVSSTPDCISKDAGFFNFKDPQWLSVSPVESESPRQDLSPIDDKPKYISQKARDGISKEGLSMKFSFNDKVILSDQSHLPGGAVPQATNTTLVPSQGELSPVKQVAVIRPVMKHKAALTEQEVEKNQINKAKSIESKIVKSDESCVSDKPPVWEKKPWQSQNTMVFNFSDRKSVPDYIENDGTSLCNRRTNKVNGEATELDGSGPGSGDEDWDALSPCNVRFIGDNILINGKSSLKKEPRPSKLRIQFNDEATTTFEYPSEESILEEGTTPTPPPAPQPPNPLTLGGGTLSSYTPHKTSGAEKFELGVTRTSPLNSPVDSNGDTPGKDSKKKEEEDEYLKPVDPDEVSPWSQETTTDMLF